MSGGGQSTQTTKNALPSWAVPYAQGLLGMGSQLYAPGGQPGQMPANMQQQVAGMTPDQIQAMSMIQQRAGGPALSNIPSQAALPTGVAAGSTLPTAGTTPNSTVGGVAAPPNAAGGVSNPPVAAPAAPPAAPPTAPPTKTNKPAKKKKKA